MKNQDTGNEVRMSRSKEDLPESELEEELAELEPEKPIGLVQHLHMIGEKLLAITRKEKNPERKAEYFEVMAEILEEDGAEIQGMIEELNQELPEKVAQITREIDEKFAGASNYFLDAVELYIQYLSTEDPALVESALNSIKQGSIALEEADAKAQALYGVPEGSVEA